MIRWRFVITRGLILAAVLVLLSLGLGPAAKFATIKGLEQVTGAKAEIASASVGLFPPRVQYEGFQVADPRSDKEMKNAFQADSIQLVIDGDALLHRRWVANSGRISGIEIGSRREASGHFAPQVSTPEDDGQSMLSQLVSGVADRVADQAKAAVGSLETVNRSKAIRKRWEADYDVLVEKARELEKQIREIRDRARGIDNPLRDWPELERTLALAAQSREDLLEVRRTMDALPDRLKADLVSLDEAKQIDIAKVDRFVPGDLSNTAEFGVEMMADSIRDQLALVRSYLDGGRTLANYTVVAPDHDRDRGATYDLLEAHRPEIMVRQCDIHGLMRADGQTYSMTGILENLSPTPELLEEPTRARLHLEGPDIIRLEYVRDRRADAEIDLVTIHWPEIKANSMRLGKSSEATIAVDGGVGELWVQVRTEGNQVNGRLVSKQTGLKMGLNVDPKYAKSPAAVSLNESLAAVDHIEIDARFDGTWRDMDMKVSTNLNQIFHNAAKQAMIGQYQDAKAKAIAKINEAHLQQSLELREWLTSRQTEAQTLLAQADQSIQEMSQKVYSEVGDADRYLGKLRSKLNGRLLQ